jgi:hypothetical protein
MRRLTRPSGSPTAQAFAAQLDHQVGAKGGELLLAADPLIQLSRSSFSAGEGAGIELYKHRVQGRGRLTGAAAGRSHGPLADRLGLRAGPPTPCRRKACAAAAAHAAAGMHGTLTIR